MSIYYRPTDGLLADVIPFYWKGSYHLFYLNPGNGGREGTPWAELVTRDFARLEDWGEVMTQGGKADLDLDNWTGSVFEHDGTFHIFYTGHNGIFEKEGQPGQLIMARDQSRPVPLDQGSGFPLPARDGIGL